MNENAVIQSLQVHLETSGYVYESHCLTTQRGRDLVMARTSPIKRIIIEAKGNTSSREGSKRYGKPFTDSQCADHFSRAFYTACKTRDEIENEEKPYTRVAMGLAYSTYYAKYELWTRTSRRDLDIGLLWVSEQGVITVEGDWVY